MKVQNKWIRAAIPALLLHCSIGTVYCWSIFSQEIADYIGFSKGATEWAFSFAIFFLGMSAAFLGNVVEKDIHHGRRSWYGIPFAGKDADALVQRPQGSCNRTCRCGIWRGEGNRKPDYADAA